MRPGDAPSSSGWLAFWPQQASPGGPTTVASPPRGFYCQLCQLECSGPQPWRQHVESARHMKMEADFKQRTGRDAPALHGSPSCSGSSPSPSVCGSEPPSPARRPPGMESRAFFCETCQLGCSGPEPWKQHIQSAKHLKRVSLERTAAGQPPGQSPGQSPSRPGSSLSVEDVLRGCGGSPASAASPSPSPAGTYFCTFCRLSCTGLAPWKEHVQSAKHLKRKAQAELGPRGTADGVGVDGVASDSAPMEAGMATKAVAMTEADGPTSYRSPLMNFANDTRSLPMACADSVPPVATPPFSTPAAAPPATAGVGSVGDSFHCAACDVTCYCLESWRQHADSARHIKLSMTARSGGRDFTSSTGTSSAASAASGWVMADGVPSSSAGPPRANPYYCDVCRLSCSGPEPWKQHIQSGKHLKMAAQAGQPTSAPDLHRSVSVSSTDSFVVLSGPSTGPPRANPYYCDICRIPCSGPEPWKQHIQSGKHLKMAQQYGGAQGHREQLRPATAQSDVSSISVPMETGEEQIPRPSINPFSPLCSDAVLDGAAETVGQTEVDGAGADLGSPDRPESGLAAQLASPTAESTPPDSVSGRSTPSSVASSARLSSLNGPSGLGGLSSVSALRSLGALGAVSSLPGGMYRCNVCQLDCTGPQPLQQHLNSVKHIKMTERQRSLPGMYPASPNSAPPVAYATVGEAMSGGSLGAYAMDVVSDSQQLDPCRSIRIGSGLHDLLDRADGISEQQSLLAGEVLRQLHPEGLVAFLEDLPLVRCNEPFSRARC